MIGRAEKSSKVCRIPALQSLRGLFAVFIFLHHLGLFEAGGDAGVGFFIMLSGFVMSAGYSGRMADHSLPYRMYFNRRWGRIYPYHLIGFAAALALMKPFYGSLTPWVWASNLTMTQSWIPIRTFYFSCDAPSWCLSDLFFCYALFPWLSRWIGASSGKACSIVLAGIMAIYLGVILYLPENMWMPVIYINPAFRLVDFIIGMLLWRAMKRMKRNIDISNRSNTSYAKASLIEISSIALYAGWIYAYPMIPGNISLASYWWIPSSIIIGVFTMTDAYGGVITGILRTEAAQRLGDLSFAFYMIHYPIICGFRTLHRHGILTGLPVAADTVVIFIACLLAAWLCEKAVRLLNA